MKKVWIWGAGYYYEYVKSCIKKDCDILGIIDRDYKGQSIKKNCKVVPIEKAIEYDFDYIVVSICNDKEIECIVESLNIDKKKIIYFWRSETEKDVLISRTEMVLRLLKERDTFRARLSSAPYEWGIQNTPSIKSIDDLIDKILSERCSLCRFGDGEFDIMLDEGNPWFQHKDSELKNKLIKIIGVQNEKCIVAIAQNFTELDRFTDEAADEIRRYMEGDKRNRIMNLLSDEVVYYDAYVSRPYILWKNKKEAHKRFERLKELFKHRDILVVEGFRCGLGIGNDLFSEATSVHRILCPEKDAWDKYADILEIVKKHANDKNCLVCISLGPTATVLAYDLSQMGIQALDIGQIDNEYEWFLMKASERTPIENKQVAELPNIEQSWKINNEDFKEEILERIV